MGFGGIQESTFGLRPVPSIQSIRPNGVIESDLHYPMHGSFETVYSGGYAHGILLQIGEAKICQNGIALKIQSLGFYAH